MRRRPLPVAASEQNRLERRQRQVLLADADQIWDGDVRGVRVGECARPVDVTIESSGVVVRVLLLCVVARNAGRGGLFCGVG
jgi:hypothetical protein